MIWEIINQVAQAYRGEITPDRWHEPYMSKNELKMQLTESVMFYAYEEDRTIQGVMGIQDMKDVTLIGHAHVPNQFQRKGIGSRLLIALHQKSDRPYSVGTWSAAIWAIQFYQKHGFKLVPKSKFRFYSRSTGLYRNVK